MPFYRDLWRESRPVTLGLQSLKARGQVDNVEEGSVRSSKSGHKMLRIALVALVLLSVVDQGPQASSQPSRELEMTVHLDDTAQTQSKLPKFRVELRNVGDHDLILNLGFTLANGRRQYPNAIVLTIIDPQERARQFDLIGPAGVAGRMDPLILPLPAGSTFSLPVDLDKYWAAASKEFEYKFQRGSYSIEAQFRGKTVSSQEANLDVKGIALMPYWTERQRQTSCDLKLTTSWLSSGDSSTLPVTPFTVATR